MATTTVSTTQVSEIEFEDVESERADDRSAPSEYDIITIPADYTLATIYDKWKDNEIVIPKLQQNCMWDINRASRLIESFMVGLPIPPV